MEKSKSNKSFYIKIILIFHIPVFLIYWCLQTYSYEEELTGILGIDNVKINSKKIVECGGIGEWYLCETYILDKKSINDFLLTGKVNNFFCSKDDSWIKIDWQKLPFEKDKFEVVNTMVFNYESTSAIKKLSTEMNQIICTENGYYSMLCKPSVENPIYIVFFLLDIIKGKLYVVDLKLF